MCVSLKAQNMFSQAQLDTATHIFDGTATISGVANNISQRGWGAIAAFADDYHKACFPQVLDWKNLMNTPRMILKSKMMSNKFLEFPMRTLNGRASEGFSITPSATLVTNRTTNLDEKSGLFQQLDRARSVVAAEPEMDYERMAFASFNDNYDVKVARGPSETCGWVLLRLEEKDNDSFAAPTWDFDSELGRRIINTMNELEPGTSKILVSQEESQWDEFLPEPKTETQPTHFMAEMKGSFNIELRDFFPKVSSNMLSVNPRYFIST